MNKYFIFVISIILILCDCDLISPNDEHNENESKLKKEVWYNWDGNLKLEVIEYEYYENGLLKHVSKGIDEIYWEQYIYYNENNDIDKEIIYEGSYSIDTVNYYYNDKNLLILKETIHITPSISYRNTIEYKYNENDMLIETVDKRGNQNTIYTSIFEYDGDLIEEKRNFVDDLHIRTFKYEYDNGIKTKETIYFYGNVEYTYIFKYKKNLLVKIEGYFSTMHDLDSVEEYKYNEHSQLVEKKVKVPLISSYMNYIIYYEYF
jgi:hypothetical protein